MRLSVVVLLRQLDGDFKWATVFVEFVMTEIADQLTGNYLLQLGLSQWELPLILSNNALLLPLPTDSKFVCFELLLKNISFMGTDRSF